MREILFRGKRKLGNEWVEGSLHTEKFTDDEEYLCCEINQCDVYPETVGQYTGLTDKNGKKIFEGDIVKYKYSGSFINNIEDGEYITEEIKTVKFCDGMLYPIPFVEYCADSYYSHGLFDFEVIGNIHDNPDLLKGE